MSRQKKKLTKNVVQYIMNYQSVCSILRLEHARTTPQNVKKNLHFLPHIYNHHHKGCGSWNDGHAHKISAQNFIRIFRYRAFNLEKYGSLIFFSLLINKLHLELFKHTQVKPKKIKMLTFSFLSLLSSLSSFDGAWKRKEKWCMHECVAKT